MKSYSQCKQDLYAFDKCNNIKNGFYIEIGAYDPIDMSNSYMLENEGWNGISFDITDLGEKWCSVRKNKFVCCNATNFDFASFFSNNNVPKVIDYLSLDIDVETLNCLKNLPLNEYKFRCITIEHDEYIRGSKMKNEMRSILKSHSYILDVPDVASNGYIFEDWWIS